MNTGDLIHAWREILIDPDKSWVLFEHGTCVILSTPEKDLAAQASALMKEWGPVHAGSSAGDFNVITLNNGLGWVVTCHHSDILTLVGAQEAEADASTLVIGLQGRGQRDLDAGALNIVHVEDKRLA